MMMCRPCPGARIDARVRVDMGRGGLAHQVAQLMFVWAAKWEAQELAGWVVYSEYEYGGSLSTKWGPKKWVIFGSANRPIIEAIHTLLVEAAQDGPARKPDLMMIPPHEDAVYLAEIGTNAAAKARELDEKLNYFRNRASRSENALARRISWKPSSWVPNWHEGCRASMPTPSGHYICAEPTWRDNPHLRRGVLLYEVHRDTPKEAPYPVPVPLPNTLVNRLRDYVRGHPIHGVPVRTYVEQLFQAMPDLREEIARWKARIPGHMLVKALVAVLMAAAIVMVGTELAAASVVVVLATELVAGAN